MSRVLVLGCALAMLPATLTAQTAEVRGSGALLPDSIAVGDVTLAAVRVRVPPGVRVEFPDTLDVAGNVERAGNRMERSDTTNGVIEVTAAYPVTAWKPGPLQLPDARVLLLSEAGTDTLLVSFPEGVIGSVLPIDTAGVEPRPARDVLGANRVWWPLALGILLAAALATVLLMAWRRRRQRPVAAPPIERIPARAVALGLLDGVRQLRMIENGEIKRAYTVIAEALRGYLASIEPAWGADLTTTELSVMLSLAGEDVGDALDVLSRADLVKFARAEPPHETAHADLSTARRWVTRFGPVESDAALAEVA